MQIALLPVGVVLDPGVRVVMRELRGRSGPVTEKEREREKTDRKKETGEIRESNQEGLVNPTHTHTCTSRMNPQESDGGERQYEAQM